jgi:hypothetical protein
MGFVVFRQRPKYRINQSKRGALCNACAENQP